MPEVKVRQISFHGGGGVWVANLTNGGRMTDATKFADDPGWKDDLHHPVYAELAKAGKKKGLTISETIKFLEDSDEVIIYQSAS